MSYAIMRAEKLKTHQIHFSQNHNERNHKSYSNEDINLEKTKDNYHLIESKNYSRDTEYIIQKNYKSTKTIRKDAVKNVELIFTSDKDFFDKLTPEDERKFFEKSLEFAQEYFEEVNAPYKQMFIMENMTHGLLESDSEGFSEIVHQIAEIEKER